MKNLVLVRHGTYNHARELDDNGKEQIQTIAEILRQRMSGSFYLASSGVKRADQSAEILRLAFSIESLAKLPVLNYQDSYLGKSDAEAIHKTLKDLSAVADNIILVTHLGVVEGFPGYFMKTEWGQQPPLIRVEKGSAVHLDIESRKHQIVIPDRSLVSGLSIQPTS